MIQFILLDSSPLSLACRSRAHPAAASFHVWMDALLARGEEVVVPEFADYEVRRELERVGATPSLRRLDALVSVGGLIYAPITTAQMRTASTLWADARNRGVPTASADALDADVILAACAETIGDPGDVVIVATHNVGHLSRYCDARPWTSFS